MFLNNKYKTIYNDFIESRKIRNFRKTSTKTLYEEHHIIPKSLGGSNDPDNIVSLTPREHYFAHLLLVKITEGKDQIKMSQASRFMSGVTSKRKVSCSREYDLAKRLCLRAMQSAGRNYLPEKELQDEILTSIVDFEKVLERGTCKTCGIRPRSINYYKNNKPYYRAVCGVCTANKNPFKIPKWIRDGYLKLRYCEMCNFSAKYTEQLTVIDSNEKYKTICLNCQAEILMNKKTSSLRPTSDF